MEIKRNNESVKTQCIASLQREKTTISVISECKINDDSVILNGQTIITRTGESDNWMADIYHSIGMQYPKFFKMDNLCQRVRGGRPHPRAWLQPIGPQRTLPHGIQRHLDEPIPRLFF